MGGGLHGKSNETKCTQNIGRNVDPDVVATARKYSYIQIDMFTCRLLPSRIDAYIKDEIKPVNSSRKIEPNRI